MVMLYGQNDLWGAFMRRCQWGGGDQATYTHMLWWPPNMAVIQSLKGERVPPKQKREISMFDLHL